MAYEESQSSSSQFILKSKIGQKKEEEVSDVIMKIIVDDESSQVSQIRRIGIEYDSEDD
eukprot:CAMPEP_0202978992 /NCGR_PEP_ID=MMETSP1396-20130829/85269_1 /ASSEMBLY_ACC=CAM_ASM_000872 /TAXON_ID= /ORGANISM="Pseudokeronopsis sp., Strain Brazil" /LENGTH=58 /DNA_ID=CAMNT_0049718223 /DNA_START=488 /DNA_END=664 /DNA_ORIENTATION=+